jgi:hypothetical protein
MQAKTFEHGRPFNLESGAIIPGFRLAYTTAGQLNEVKDNVVWIFDQHERKHTVDKFIAEILRCILWQLTGQIVDGHDTYRVIVAPIGFLMCKAIVSKERIIDARAPDRGRNRPTCIARHICDRGAFPCWMFHIVLCDEQRIASRP